jgi:hypothetical protein
MPIGEFHKDVFETRGKRANLGDGDIAFQEQAAKVIEVEMVLDESMDGLAKNCCAANAG